MSKKIDVWDGEINKHTDWGGDVSTDNKPVSGTRVQQYIKGEFEKRAGIFYYDAVADRYLIFSDQENLDMYLKSPSEHEGLILGEIKIGLKDVESLQPIIITSRFRRVSGSYEFTLESNQKEKLYDYFESGKKNAVYLVATNSDNASEVITFAMLSKRNKDSIREMFFGVIGSDKTVDLGLFSVVIRFTRTSGTTGTEPEIVSDVIKNEESEYKFNRYTPSSNFNMNDWTESGGIAAALSIDGTTTGIVGENIPDGFTLITGYVLKNSRGCVQVVTDAVLKTLMVRFKLYNGEWTTWKELGTGSSHSTEPVILEGTVKVDGTSKVYTLKNSSFAKDAILGYIEDGYRTPLVLKILPLNPIEGSVSSEVYLLAGIYSSDDGLETRTLYFQRVDNNKLFSLKVKLLKRPTGSYTTVIVDEEFDLSGDYKNYRYINDNYSDDINTWTKSGGIAVTSGTIKNIPDGFTKFNGYVLADGGGCTQLVTDIVLQKTFLRTQTSNGWSVWREISSKANSDSELIVFTGKYTGKGNDPKKTYTIDTGQEDKFSSYIDGSKNNNVVISFKGEDGFEVFAMEKVEGHSTSPKIIFSNYSSESIHRAYIYRAKLTDGDWVGDLKLQMIDYAVSDSEYKYKRYVPMESFDMNEWVESGGIIGILYEGDSETPAISGANIPKGFTDFYGYVLKNYGAGSDETACCTQVVTDRILKKTMIRSSVPTEDYSQVEWLPWLEVGKDIDSIKLQVIEFTVKATVNEDTGDYNYILDDGQRDKFTSYVSSQENKKVILRIDYTDSKLGNFTRIYNMASYKSPTGGGVGNYVMSFYYATGDSTGGVVDEALLSLQQATVGWNTLRFELRKFSCSDSEYKSDRYFPEEAFDMNDWFSSGGISVVTDESVVGSNIPSGFTEFSGFVLESVGVKSSRKSSAIQVVTDRVLKKTMIRVGDESSSGNTWSDWVEIGIEESSKPVVFTGTVTISGTDKTYVLDEGQDLKFTRYFDNGMSSPVLLKFLAADKYSHNEVFVLQDTSIDGASRTMNFTRITSGLITRMYLQLSRVSSGAWSGTLTPKFYEYKFGESEYKYDRYFGGEIDMNECTESGGIYVISTEEVPAKVQNGPGFTSFTGFVLKSPGALTTTCTQVVSDKETGKIMMRFSFLSADFRSREWSEWKEITNPYEKQTIFIDGYYENGNYTVINPEVAQEILDLIAIGVNKKVVYRVFNSLTSAAMTLPAFEEPMDVPMMLPSLDNAVTESGSPKALSEVSELPKGTRNLLLKSNKELSNTGSGRIGGYKITSSDLTIGKEYTLVACITTSEGSNGVDCWFNSKDGVILLGTGDKVVVSKTFTLTSAAWSEAVFYHNPQDIQTNKIHWAILVEGDKAPNTWIPAPEDIKEMHELSSLSFEWPNSLSLKFKGINAEKSPVTINMDLTKAEETWSGSVSEIKEGSNNVYVVSEYPSDLSQYADGSIFIKEEATV